MNHDGFQYRVEALVTLTGADLADLYDVAHNHYDWKCKALAKPRPKHARSETDGWIYDQMAYLVSKHELGTEGSNTWATDPDKLAELCRANPELTRECTMTWRLLDTVCKTREMDAYRGKNANPELSSAIWRIFKDMQAESNRLNPRPD